MIPIHATATTHPRQLRWVIAPDRLPPRGTVWRAPGKLGTLLDDGVIDELVVRAADVLITLSAGNRWRDLGDDIREALTDALSDLAGWQVDPSAESSSQLAATAAELLAGSIGSLAESHGGSIELVSVSGDTVTVRMSGACHGCPASGSTLYDKLQRELRRRLGVQVTVCSENDSTAVSLGKKLLSLMVH
ncbi:MAG: NifU family protein [Mycobacterium sp.]|nr:NifU family protein [Mycobacterium sp.]